MMSSVWATTSEHPTLNPTPVGSPDVFSGRPERRGELGALLSCRLKRAREQHEELVAAPPKHVVRLAHVAFQEQRDVLEQPVSRFVTECVVHHLELVDVHEQEGQRHVVPLVTLQLASDHLVEEPPVVASGERIGDRQAVQLGLGFQQTTVGDP